MFRKRALIPVKIDSISQKEIALEFCTKTKVKRKGHRIVDKLPKGNCAGQTEEKFPEMGYLDL